MPPSQGEWNLYKLVATIPANEAFRPLNEGGCPLVKNYADDSSKYALFHDVWLSCGSRKS